MPYYPERKPLPPEGDVSNPGRKKGQAGKTPPEGPSGKLRGWLARVGMILSAALLIYGLVRLIGYGAEYAASRNTSRELQRIAETVSSAAPAEEASEAPAPSGTERPGAAEGAETSGDRTEPDGADAAEAGVPAPPEPASLYLTSYPDNPNLKISERFLSLRKRSRYIIGWISLDGVEEAVCQKDNSYYLDHDALGRKNANGAIFLDESIPLLPRPDTLILYGHNMKSGNMFGRLKKYEESAYFFRHQILGFDSLYEEGKYAVFAVFRMDTVPGSPGWFNLWSTLTDQAAAREAAIRKMEGRSACASVVDVQAEDQLLLLVTCLDGETERLVVAARRLRKNETENSLTLRQR